MIRRRLSRMIHALEAASAWHVAQVYTYVLWRLEDVPSDTEKTKQWVATIDALEKKFLEVTKKFVDNMGWKRRQGRGWVVTAIYQAQSDKPF